MRVFLFLLDGLGVGAMPDANEFGDSELSNTFLNVIKNEKINLKTFKKLGLFNIDGINLYQKNVIGCFGKMQEKSKAKDSTAGHWEIAGKVLEKPFVVFKDGKIPNELVKKIQSAIGCKTIFNRAGSGTELIKKYGQESIDKKLPILYTSADSVLQVACHKSCFNIETIYEFCKKIRSVAVDEFCVGRIIARPFDTRDGEFFRTNERKDFSVKPNEKLLLDKIKEKKLQVIGIGKIEDIFPETQFSFSLHTQTNLQAFKQIKKIKKETFKNGILWANFNDLDSFFGHRNNVKGFLKSLQKFDKFLSKFLKTMKADDYLFVTADHGNDPTTFSTDHSREYVPLLCFSKQLLQNVNLGTLPTFSCLGDTILEIFGDKKTKNSILKKIKKHK